MPTWRGGHRDDSCPLVGHWGQSLPVGDLEPYLGTVLNKKQIDQPWYHRIYCTNTLVDYLCSGK